MNRTKDGLIIRGPLLDQRLKAGMKRLRSGSTQCFQLFSDAMHQRHKVVEEINIEAPHRSWYAEQIGGQWFWVEGCDRCNGLQENHCYKRCEEHDTCEICKVPRAEATTSQTEHIGGGMGGCVYGYKGGWICRTCNEALEAESLAAAQERIAARDEDGETEVNMADAPTCPWCGHEEEIEGETDYSCDDTERHCYTCGGDYLLTTVPMVYWDSKRATKKDAE